MGFRGHKNLDDVLNRVTRTNQSNFQSRLQTDPVHSMETLLARVPVSLIFPRNCSSSAAVGGLFAISRLRGDKGSSGSGGGTSYSGLHSQCEVTLCAARSVAVRHDHHRTFQQCQQGRQVFPKNQDQASRHRAVLAQVRAHFLS